MTPDFYIGAAVIAGLGVMTFIFAIKAEDTWFFILYVLACAICFGVLAGWAIPTP